MKTRTVTRTLVLLALMLSVGVAAAYAQQKHVKMTFSGTLAVSTLSLQPDTNSDEQALAGDGTLGPFTFRELHADPTAPQPSSSCSGPTHLYFPNVAGGGVFRFEDGSLLTVGVTTAGSAICIDLTAGVAHLTTNYLAMLKTVVGEAPDATVAELCWEYNRRVPSPQRTNETSLRRALRRAGFVYKTNGRGRATSIGRTWRPNARPS